MNPFEMVVLIVAIVMAARVLQSRYTAQRHGVIEERTARDDQEAIRLREEVRALKERVAVLERLATDGSRSLEQEIERLRERH